MSLTMGSAPVGHRAAGHFVPEVPREAMRFVDPSPRRIRAVRNGRTVADSRHVRMLHVHGELPRYWFPSADVDWDAASGLEVVRPPDDAPGLLDHVTFAWGDLDAWFEEDEQLIAHAIDPYHRVDVRRSSRRVSIGVDGEVLADSPRPHALFETGLPTRWYLPAEHVLARLEPSPLRTECAYKGVASYFSVRVGDQLLENIAWTYTDPRHDAAATRDLICFFNEVLDVDVDGEREERPHTPWGQPGWWRAYDEVR